MVDALLSYAPLFAEGALVTARLTAVSFIGAVLLGSVIAAFRVSPITPLRVVGLIYVEIFRNVPLMSLIIVVVYALPEIDILLGFEQAIMVAMTLVGSSFIGEALRSGVNGVEVGQIDAARAVGMTFGMTVVHIVLPQAFRSMVQPIVNVFIGVLLSSSLAGVVGVMDLTATVDYINNREALGISTFLVVAAMYITVSLLAGLVGDRLERRLRVQR